MGFHKRIYNISQLRSKFKNDGLASLRKWFNADAHIFEDVESSRVFNLLKSGREHELIILLQNEQIRCAVS